MKTETSRASLIFACSLACAATLYAACLAWGPLYPTCADEINAWADSLRLLGERRLTDYEHGPLAFELSASIELIRYLVFRALGYVRSPQDFLVTAIADPSSHYRILHVLSACAGLGCLAAIYRLGRIFGGPLVGALSALFCATNLTFILMTTIYKEDPFYWFFLFVAMERSWAAAQGPDRRAAALGGAAVGAALSAKYLALCGLPLLGLPILRGDRTRFLQVGLSLICAGAVFLALFPFLVTNSGDVMRSMRALSAGTVGQSSNPPLALWNYLRFHLPNLAGFVVPVLGVIEFCRRLREDPKGPILLAAAPVGLLLLMGLRRSISYAYYIFPVAAFLWILASSLAVHVSRNSSGWRKGLPFILCLLPLFDGAFLRGAVKYVILATGPDTRVLAQNYLEARATDGACVLVNMGSAGENIFGPQLVPANLPQGHGAYTNARVKAFAGMNGKKFALRIVNHEPGWIAESGRLAPESAKGCEWLVLGRHGRLAAVEYGLSGENPEIRTSAPAGFQRLETIESYPHPHSKSYSVFSSLDYEELRSVSVLDLWRNRAMGLSFDIYKASGGGNG